MARSDQNNEMRPEAEAIVTCPGCKKPMKRKSAERVPDKELSDVLYVCEECGTETKRLIKEEKG